MNKYPHLFSPIKIGGLVFKNRIMSAPTSLADLSTEGYPTMENIAYYALKAQGGAAVVTVGDAIVQGATGRAHPKQVLMDDPGLMPHIVKEADAIKRHGAIASLELDHGGRECRRPFIEGFPLGPMDEANYFGREIKAMSVERIESIIDDWGKAALTAKNAGFDMCMVHAGHGWLLGQFLSPVANKRNDEYGGNFENRCRFLLSVIKSIRKRCGYNFPIEVRISGDEFSPVGYDQAYGIEIAKALDGKVDLIHVSVGTLADTDTSIRCQPTIFLERGCNVYLAAEIKKHVKTPVATVGSISEPAHMEEIIASGKADIVAMARALIADPFLPKKAKAGQDEDIRPCLRCLVCETSITGSNVIKCTVNPVIGREFESQFVKPHSTGKKVMVAGGGPAGMEAAITAANLGHDVTLYEKTDALGGAIKFAAYVPFKVDLDDFRKYLERQLQKSGVKVVLNTAVTPELVGRESPDVLMAAVGAEAIVPAIPGISGKNVIMAEDVYTPDVVLGNKTVIVGGGLVGCETGLYLAQKGKDVTILEMLPELAVDANSMHRMGLLFELKKYTKTCTGTRCTAITAEGAVAVELDGKEQHFAADTIIISVGSKALSDVIEKLRAVANDFVPVGDCVKAQKVGEAIWAGYYAAYDL